MSIAEIPELVALHAQLGIPEDYLTTRELPIYAQANALVWMDGCDGPYQVEPGVARAWEALRKASLDDGVEVFLVSAFRSYAYQAQLIRSKLETGDTITDILTVVAPPGCSQHHTGLAIDLGTPGSEFLEEDFETTDAFSWLVEHASRFGFVMPFGRNNDHGFIYEPWHWYWTKQDTI